MTDSVIKDIQDLDNKIDHLNQFKLIAEELVCQIDSVENSVKHIKYIRSSDGLLFSPRIYLDSITPRERNFLFYCGKGREVEDALLLAYERKNLKPETLKLKLTIKACVEVEYFEQLAIACYQYMLKNIALFDIQDI